MVLCSRRLCAHLHVARWLDPRTATDLLFYEFKLLQGVHCGQVKQKLKNFKFSDEFELSEFQWRCFVLRMNVLFEVVRCENRKGPGV